MIELENISKSFKEKSVISDFSMKIKENEFVSIIGTSGSGKTTLLNIIGLLEKADSGIIRLSGYENPDYKEVMNLRRYMLGYIFQNYVLMDNESVYNNLLISRPYNKDFTQDSVLKSLEKVGLDSTYLYKRVYQLSGGEQQRVALARVILKPCRIILADEPTGNLDKENKQMVITLLHELRNLGKTIICVTHDDEMAKQSDRVIRI